MNIGYTYSLSSLNWERKVVSIIIVTRPKTIEEDSNKEDFVNFVVQLIQCVTEMI